VKRDTASGLALVLGSVCLVVTMVLHPTAGGMEGLVRESALRVRTHALALIAIPVTFLGFLGLHRRLAEKSEFARPALVAYAFACAAGVCAGVINGLAAPAFAMRIARESASADAARVVLAYSFELNSAFAKVFMAGAAASLVLWAVAILKTRAFHPGFGWLGGGLGGAGLVAVLGGWLGTSVHEFGVFVLGFAGWTAAVGAGLLRAQAPSHPGTGTLE